MADFPQRRLRRLRRTEAVRRLVRETQVDIADLVYPLFVTCGKGKKEEIESMPGIFRLSEDKLAAEIEEIAGLGISAVILFGIPQAKDEVGTSAFAPNGVVQGAIKSIKKAVPNLLVMTDVCLCEYTSHGHCGVVSDGEVDNDETLQLLARMAVSHAEAGADVVAPSDMMDGRIGAIRKALDDSNFSHIPILSYAAKYASAFYGPFREAAQSTPEFGDRRGYQMDPANIREALREIEQDIIEGADMVMVKPALAYLDVIREARMAFHYPLAAYNVSGEYSMVKAAAQRGWIDERRIVLEILTAIKRAGADIIISYHAKEAARWLQ
ncbi:MAG: porphobilinogen synthase [Dehalococcoidia bacterium]|nr:porphobilinogen synthase [Dehalococcoidia bacterium]